MTGWILTGMVVIVFAGMIWQTCAEERANRITAARFEQVCRERGGTVVGWEKCWREEVDMRGWDR